MIEYIFKRKGIIHVIQCKPSANRKLGLYKMVIQTYHFSESQLYNFKDDVLNCMGCPYSFNMNAGKSGGCYCHKGYQAMGLTAMVNRLKKLEIGKFNKILFNSFINYISQYDIQLCRVGAYGEGVLLPISVIKSIIKISKAHTAYTHAWTDPKYRKYNKYFMASTHNQFETAIANSYGFRAFQSSIIKDKKMAICPASKEFTGNKKTCIQCAACDGTSNNKKSNIFILKH